MKSPLLFLFFLATAVIALGSNTLRDWKTDSGATYTADLVSYDEAAKMVELRLQDDTVIHVAYDDFSVTVFRLLRTDQSMRNGFAAIS